MFQLQNIYLPEKYSQIQRKIIDRHIKYNVISINNVNSELVPLWHLLIATNQKYFHYFATAQNCWSSTINCCLYCLHKPLFFYFLAFFQALSTNAIYLYIALKSIYGIDRCFCIGIVAFWMSYWLSFYSLVRFRCKWSWEDATLLLV